MSIQEASRGCVRKGLGNTFSERPEMTVRWTQPRVLRGRTQPRITLAPAGHRGLRQGRRATVPSAARMLEWFSNTTRLSTTSARPPSDLAPLADRSVHERAATLAAARTAPRRQSSINGRFYMRGSRATSIRGGGWDATAGATRTSCLTSSGWKRAGEAPISITVTAVPCMSWRGRLRGDRGPHASRESL
jgi:hypothetical protein